MTVAYIGERYPLETFREEDEIREAVPQAVARLIHTRDDAFVLFRIVRKTAGAIIGGMHQDNLEPVDIERLKELVHHLGHLISRWDSHNGDWGQSVADVVDELHGAICGPLNCLALGHAEAALEAIGIAALWNEE